MQLNLYDAKTRLSELVEAASQGETVVIAKAGRPLAKLGPVDTARKPVRLGRMKGKIKIGRDFVVYNRLWFLADQFHIAIKRQTCSRGDETSHDDVFFQSAEIIHLPADRRFSKYSSCFLERSRGNE